MISDVHRLLDRHLATLERLGSTLGEIFVPPPTEDAVRTSLRAAGYHDRDDVVALFTWRGYPSVDHQLDVGPHVFDETCYLAPCEEAIEEHQFHTQIRDDTLSGDVPDAVLVNMFPGPSFYLPVAFTGAGVWVSIDCRPDPVGGTVLHCALSEQAKALFSSLSDAIAAATYCLETGIGNSRRWPQSSRQTIRGEQPNCIAGDASHR